MQLITNPYVGAGLADETLAEIPWPSTRMQAPGALLARCPQAEVTPLVQSAGLAGACGVAEVWIKDERARMGLGSFKALGAAYVIACDAAAGDARGAAYVTASAGNHGLSVAAGAAAFGARAIIYLAATVPEAFAARLRALGAEVRRAGATYEDSMAAAGQAADEMGARLLSDSSWAGYTDRPLRVMEGYLALMAEAMDQIPAPPTHVCVQAGVGGLAGAVAASVRAQWGAEVHVCVVEPDAAPALYAGIVAGRALETEGPVSAMGRLDCKVPSLIALKGLARDANSFALLSEAEGQAGAALAAAHGLPSTPSGAAGLAALAQGRGAGLPGLTAAARVMVILSEGSEA